MRFRSVDKLIKQARQGLQYRRRIGLVGPAVTDHPQIKELLAGCADGRRDIDQLTADRYTLRRYY